MSDVLSNSGFGTITNTTIESGGNRVIWKPYADPGQGYVTTWEQAVYAVNLVQGPTIIQIEADPWEDDPVVIPGGYWGLNDTTIVGTTTYAHGGQYWDSNNFWGDSIGASAHRGAQILLQVFTQGYNDSDSAYDHPCRLHGVRGLKDMFWRGERSAGSPSGLGDVLSKDGDGNVTFHRTDGNLFSPIDTPDVSVDLPSTITISGSGASNNGTFNIISWIDADTVTYNNNSATVESGLSFDLARINAVFFNNEPFGKYSEFTLDNVDFRSGGAASFYVGANGRSFIRLKNNASIRWYNVFGDSGGKIVVQSDGSPCWVGNYAFYGDGQAKFYIEPGMEFHDNQEINYETFNSIIWFTPDDGSKWGSSPVCVQQALNQLADRVYSLEHP